MLWIILICFQVGQVHLQKQLCLLHLYEHPDSSPPVFSLIPFIGPLTHRKCFLIAVASLEPSLFSLLVLLSSYISISTHLFYRTRLSQCCGISRLCHATLVSMQNEFRHSRPPLSSRDDGLEGPNSARYQLIMNDSRNVLLVCLVPSIHFRLDLMNPLSFSILGSSRAAPALHSNEII